MLSSDSFKIPCNSHFCKKSYNTEPSLVHFYGVCYSSYTLIKGLSRNLHMA